MMAANIIQRARLMVACPALRPATGRWLGRSLQMSLYHHLAHGRTSPSPVPPPLYWQQQQRLASTFPYHYDVHAVESRWRGTPVPRDMNATSKNTNEKPYYVLAMFPYPSGHLHMGHVRVYTLSDMLARYNRMRGRVVVHPMGWDAFGLPAENAAVDRGIAPCDWTVANIAHMKQQLQLLAIDLDWDRELATCDPEYYRHTQTLFLRMFEAGLAYQKEAVVNWDPVDKTVLANEQVDAEGRSWRSGAIVEKRLLKQWFLRITDYAEDLLSGLDRLEWPSEVKQMQRNWIGKSAGMTIPFTIAFSDNGIQNVDSIRVFTSRPETICGVTFLAVGPTHPLVTEKAQLLPASHRSAAIAAATTYQAEQDAQLPGGTVTTKLGTPLGIHATNPATGAKVPVYVTNYVLGSYGTGAVMGVPAHDERDAEFAAAYGLPVVEAIDTSSSDGSMVVVAPAGHALNGKSAGAAAQWLETAKMGTPTTTYRLRDWLVSRQRSWGCPIPIVHCPDCGPVAVPDPQLPVRVADSIADFFDPTKRQCTCPKCANPLAQRDADTMDTFVDSSWYFFRYLDSHNRTAPFDPAIIARAGMPVDMYIGGIEHAILHLLYARFVTKFVHQHMTPLPLDGEPFKALLAQGMVHGRTLRDPTTGRYLKPGESVRDPDRNNLDVVVATGELARVSYEKMSKSKHNGVAPEDVVAVYGADVARAFIISKAPPAAVLEWDADAVVGIARWCNRVWALVADRIARWPAVPVDGDRAAVAAAELPVDSMSKSERDLWVITNTLHQQITHSFETSSSLNTVPSNLIKLTHAISEHLSVSSKNGSAPPSPVLDTALTRLVQLMAPMTPCLAQELWTHQLRQSGHVWAEWPQASTAVKAATATVVMQINGKTRATLELPVDALAENVEAQLRASAAGNKWIAGKPIKKVIIARGGQLVNFVLGSA
ncbi:hypothetical protein BC828DRAFT_199048 [Blastocladiella britannica]|nr:hypothetical protein BC828DRAFT_199048 [Blastocladiella britannica]